MIGIVPRTVNAIINGTDGLASLSALTNTQKTNIWTDYLNNQRWLEEQSDRGEIVRLCIEFGQALGLTWANAPLTMKERLVAWYIQYQPTYAVNPSFDATINVPGRMVI